MLLLTYIAFIWLVILHTFEEISCYIMDLEHAHIKLTPKRYSLGASFISTINLGTLAAPDPKLPSRILSWSFHQRYLRLLLSTCVHTIGYIKEGKKAHGLGAGFYLSVPLEIIGIIVFIQLIQAISAFGR